MQVHSLISKMPKTSAAGSLVVFLCRKIVISGGCGCRVQRPFCMVLLYILYRQELLTKEQFQNNSQYKDARFFVDSLVALYCYCVVFATLFMQCTVRLNTFCFSLCYNFRFWLLNNFSYFEFLFGVVYLKRTTEPLQDYLDVCLSVSFFCLCQIRHI